MTRQFDNLHHAAQWQRFGGRVGGGGQKVAVKRYTDKKENQIAVGKSYMRKVFLIYEEMGKYFPIYEEAVSYIWLCNCSTQNFLIYEESFILFFISVGLDAEKGGLDEGGTGNE